MQAGSLLHSSPFSRLSLGKGKISVYEEIKVKQLNSIFIHSYVTFFVCTNLTLNRVKFGFWTQSQGYVYPVMMMVNATFNRVIPGRYESRISWAGNLTSSLASFILQYVQPEDDGVEFGIHLEFGYQHI